MNKQIENSGTLVIHLEKREAFHHAEGLPIDKDKKLAIIPKGAIVERGEKNLIVKHEGKTNYFGLNSGIKVEDSQTGKKIW